MLMLESMQGAGLIRKRRDTADRRRINVFLTATARRLKPKLEHYAAQVNAIATQGIAARDLETFLRVAIQMRANLNANTEAVR
jgi:DNA-binding MarR family transcriptional regulator